MLTRTRLLQQLDQPVRFGADSIDTIAKDNHLFLKRQAGLLINRLDVKALCEVLVTVKELSQSLQISISDSVLCNGNEFVVSDLDEADAANLQHLLLRLEREILRRLVARLVDLVHQHVSDCQKDQSKHSKEWFFEFPDARHPLSTTWPWSIKPSLAVIWGVCWMFYDRLTGAPKLFDDEEGNLRNEKGEIEIPANQVYAFFAQRQGMQPQQHDRQDQSQEQQQQPQMQAIGEHMPASSKVK